MQNKKQKVHDTYYKIKPYQTIIDLSDAEMAEKLSMSVRTYNDKVLGWADFTNPEYMMLREILGVSLDELSKTRRGEMS